MASNSISPSQFNWWLKCPMRGFLSMHGGRKIPSSSTVNLGILAHTVLEYAYKFGIPTEQDFENIWAAEEKKLELSLSEELATAGLVPLKVTAHNYGLKKALMRNLVKTIHRRPTSTNIPVANEHLGTEVWLHDKSGKVSGKADLIRKTNSGIEIVDYKTGEISQKGEIKLEYKQQLELYAAMYHEMTGNWPTKLILSDIKGMSIEIPVMQENCIKTLKLAQDFFTTLTKKSSPSLVDAYPTEENCTTCGVRIDCQAFQPILYNSGIYGFDLKGRLQSVSTLPNVFLIDIQCDSIIASVSIPFTQANRFQPLLEGAILGTTFTFYNLKKNQNIKSPNSFSARPETLLLNE